MKITRSLAVFVGSSTPTTRHRSFSWTCSFCPSAGAPCVATNVSPILSPANFGTSLPTTASNLRGWKTVPSANSNRRPGR